MFHGSSRNLSKWCILKQLATGYLGWFHIKPRYEVVKKAAYFLEDMETADYAITHVQTTVTHNRLYVHANACFHTCLLGVGYTRHGVSIPRVVMQ